MHTKSVRRKHFRATLALLGQSQKTWAEAQGLSPSHVSQVLRGQRESATLVEKIDAFIERHLTADRIAS